MSRSFLPSGTLGVLAFAGVLLLGAPAFAQGAGGFEAAPGSAPIVTSNGMPVVNMATPTPISGAAAQGPQQDYSAFSDGGAPPGMYVAPLGYGAGAGAAPTQAPVYSAQTAPGNSNYSIQQQPTAGPYAQQYAQPQPYYGPQANPYGPNPYAPPPPPNAYGAPVQDYTPQPYAQPYAAPYGPQPYGPAYAQPAPLMAEPQAYAAQAPQQQNSPYTAAQRMVQGLPPQAPQYAQPQPQAYQPAPQQQPMSPAPAAMAQNPQGAVPYAAGTTAYGAPLPRTIGMTQGGGATPAEGGYTLGPGDKVRVTIFGEQDLSGEFQLDGNGNIRLPLIGMTRAVGYTQGGLEAALRAALVPNYLRNPRINVEITSYRPIYVVGAVQKPGQYSYVNNMTLLNAVALAGGFTPQARNSMVYVRSEGAVEERATPTDQPLLIRPGDTVRVETTMFWDVVNFFGPLSSPVALAATVR